MFALILFCILFSSAASLKCPKLVTINERTASNDQVFSRGVYKVKTTLTAGSEGIQQVATDLLKDISAMEFKKKSFTGVLQPKDLKKLCKDDRVTFIKQLERSQYDIKCDNLFKGQSRSAIPDSYIITAKDDRETTTSVVYSAEIASDDANSSVMIADIKPFTAKRRGFVVKMNEDAVDYICHHPLVEYIEEDQEVVSAAASQWHLDRIDQKRLPLNQQYAVPNNGSNVDIYIFDTGIKYNHSEFDHNRAVYSGYDVVDVLHNESRRGEDCNGHGTHVAGLAGGTTHGVAKGATLHSVRVLNCQGSGSVSMTVLGLYHVIDQVRQRPLRRAIINLSLTTRKKLYSQTMKDAITAAIDSGILMVAAAGNYHSDACKYSPSFYPDVITVGGMQQNDALYNKSSFAGTNYGSCVDIFAPAQKVESASIKGEHSYAVYDGTSQAASLVSGAAAIYWNMLPDGANASEVKDILLSSCVQGTLDIASYAPPSFVNQTANCLLYISTPSQKLFHDVKVADVKKLIVDMEQLRYAVSFMQSYAGVNGNILLIVLFDYMGNQKYQMEALISRKNVKTIANTLEPKGLKITFIYTLNVNVSNKFIVVFSQSNGSYKAYLKRPLGKQIKIHNKGMALHSTSVVINHKRNAPLYTTLYSNQPRSTVGTHYFNPINKRVLLRHIKYQHVHGYKLNHLTSYSIDGKEKYSLVFHQQTKPANHYHDLFNIKPHELEVMVAKLVANDNKINVVARIQYSSSKIRYVITYESK